MNDGSYCDSKQRTYLGFQLAAQVLFNSLPSNNGMTQTYPNNFTLQHCQGQHCFNQWSCTYLEQNCL